MGTWGRREWLCTYCSDFCTSISFQALWQKYAQSADCHRQCIQGTLASVCAVLWAQDALTEQNKNEHCPVRPPSPLGAREEVFNPGVSLWKPSGNSKRLSTDSWGTWPSLFQFFFCVWKALHQRSIEERTRDYFYYDYCYYFAQLHRWENLGTFCKEKFVSLFLWPN